MIIMSTSSKGTTLKPVSLPSSPVSTIARSVDCIDGDDQLSFRLLNDRERSARKRVQLIAFCSAMLNWYALFHSFDIVSRARAHRYFSLCAGSLLLFSLWAPIFQDKLGFSQMQINAVSIAGALGMYIPYVTLSEIPLEYYRT